MSCFNCGSTDIARSGDDGYDEEALRPKCRDCGALQDRDFPAFSRRFI